MLDASKREDLQSGLDDGQSGARTSMKHAPGGGFNCPSPGVASGDSNFVGGEACSTIRMARDICHYCDGFIGNGVISGWIVGKQDNVFNVELYLDNELAAKALSDKRIDESRATGRYVFTLPAQYFDESIKCAMIRCADLNLILAEFAFAADSEPTLAKYPFLANSTSEGLDSIVKHRNGVGSLQSLYIEKMNAIDGFAEIYIDKSDLLAQKAILAWDYGKIAEAQSLWKEAVACEPVAVKTYACYLEFLVQTGHEKDAATFLDKLPASIKASDCIRKIQNNIDELLFFKYKFAIAGQTASERSENLSVSVIVPSYNYARFLKKRLQSILQQTRLPDEIIILDDASTDSSLEIIRTFAAQCPLPVRIVANEHNSRNLFRQWLMGISLAKGDVIWIAEADDYCEPDFLETLLPEFADREVNIAWCDSTPVDEAGSMAGPVYGPYFASLKPHPDFSRNFSLPGVEVLKNGLIQYCCIPNVSAAIFRKSALPPNLNEIEQYSLCGDWWFWCQLALTGKMAWVAKALNWHRKRRWAANTTIYNGEMLAQHLRMQRELATRRKDLFSLPVALSMLRHLQKNYEAYAYEQGADSFWCANSAKFGKEFAGLCALLDLKNLHFPPLHILHANENASRQTQLPQNDVLELLRQTRSGNAAARDKIMANLANNWLEQLQSLELFSDDWHEFGRYLQPAWLRQKLKANLAPRTARILAKLCTLLELAQSEEWQGSVDGYDGKQFSGWAKLKNSPQSQKVDIFQDNCLLAQACECNIFRQDLLDAGLGTGKYSFLSTIDNKILDTEPCFNIRESGTGKLIAFRFYNQGKFACNYDIYLDRIGERICGWSINHAMPNAVYEIKMYIDRSYYATFDNSLSRNDLRRHNISCGTGGFSIVNPVLKLPNGKYELCFEFPDGSFSKVTELVQKDYFSPPLRNIASCCREVTVVAPLLRADADVETFLLRLRKSVDAFASIILVVEEEELAKRAKAAAPGAEILCGHGANRVELVNLALAKRVTGDVVIIQPGIMAFGRWLAGLRLCAADNPNVAIVSPVFLGEAAAKQTAPAAPLQALAKAYGRCAASASADSDLRNYGCAFLPRRALNALGGLDIACSSLEQALSKYQLSALRLGWETITDCRTAVFVESGLERCKEGWDVPEYPEAEAIHATGVEQRRLQAWQLRRAGQCWPDLNRPRLLYVMSSTIGGTLQTSMDLMAGMARMAQSFVLYSDGKVLTLQEYEAGELHTIKTQALLEPLEPYGHVSGEYDAIAAGWIYELDIDVVHIRHLIWHSLNLPKIVKQLGKTVIYSFHDYYALNPNLNLVDDCGVYCGDDYLEQGSPYRINIWQCIAPWHASQPVGHKGYAEMWRRRFAQSLKPCDAFVVMSANGCATVQQALPELDKDKFAIIPHGRDFTEFCNARQPWLPGRKIRIVLPGNINYPKGLGIIQSLAEYDKQHLQILEFHVLGRMQFAHSGIICHGSYQIQELPAKLSAIKPHFGAVFSIWEETWCHTLTELWACGLPAFVFDMGTVGERVRQCGGGWALPLGDIAQIYENIVAIARDAKAVTDAAYAVARWQAGEGAAGNVDRMSLAYFQLYREKTRPGQTCAKIVAVCADLGKATTFIRLLEHGISDFNRNISYIHVDHTQLLAMLQLKYIDAFILKRADMPPAMVDSILNVAKTNNIPYLFEIDDDLANVPPDKDPGGAYKTYRPFLQTIMARASGVTCPGAALAAKLANVQQKIHIFPNKLSLRLWSKEPAKRIKDGCVRVLYFGTPTHREDLELILPALASCHDRHANFRLLLVGIAKPGESWLAEWPFIEVASLKDEEKPYPGFVNYLQRLCCKIDFAIAPLAATEFNAMKTPLKLLEYGALGLPVVASRVEPFTGMAGMPGLDLPANENDAWEKALKARIRLGYRNRQLGRQMRNYVLATHGWQAQDSRRLDDLLMRLDGVA